MNKLIIFFLFNITMFPQVFLPGFVHTEEQVLSFKFEPDIYVHINAPSPEDFKRDRPSALILYGLPNGNSTEQTIGKVLKPGDDWHFDIQHIGAQTRFLRDKIKDQNLITIYLETSQKSWPAWKAANPDYDMIVKSLTDSLLSMFKVYDPFIILSGHSGGGRFIFSFLDAFKKIPSSVKRICFLDSNYGYEKNYTTKIADWIKSSDHNYLFIIAYNDSSVIFNGKPVVSPTGGTWYRSRMIQKDLSEYFYFNTSEDTSCILHQALDGRINIILKKNPDSKILHTMQVERNGFIHSILSGTEFENKGYEYFGERAYNKFIK